MIILVYFRTQRARVEIMTYAACGARLLLNYPGDPFERPREAFQNLCQRAGCYWGHSADVRERWRLIDFFAPVESLPSACFEDRPRCKVCGQRVATGAGGWSSPAPLYPPLQPEETLSYQPALHEECLRYAHRVIAPQIKALRESTERLASASSPSASGEKL